MSLRALSMARLPSCRRVHSAVSKSTFDGSVTVRIGGVFSFTLNGTRGSATPSAASFLVTSGSRLSSSHDPVRPTAEAQSCLHSEVSPTWLAARGAGQPSAGFPTPCRTTSPPVRPGTPLCATQFGVTSPTRSYFSNSSLRRFAQPSVCIPSETTIIFRGPSSVPDSRPAEPMAPRTSVPGVLLALVSTLTNWPFTQLSTFRPNWPLYFPPPASFGRPIDGCQSTLFDPSKPPNQKHTGVGSLRLSKASAACSADWTLPKIWSYQSRTLRFSRVLMESLRSTMTTRSRAFGLLRPVCWESQSRGSASVGLIPIRLVMEEQPAAVRASIPRNAGTARARITFIDSADQLKSSARDSNTVSLGSSRPIIFSVLRSTVSLLTTRS